MQYCQPACQRKPDGKMQRVIIVFRVNGKYYPATDENTEIFETYLHTGDAKLLKDLTNEMEF